MSFCDGIDLTQRVRTLLDNWATKVEIMRQMNIRHPKLSRICGYLAYHGLLDPQVAHNYTPTFVPDNVLEHVKQVGPFISEIGQAKAKKLFGWKAVDFYYYMAMSEVQSYLSLDEESKVPPRGKKGKRVITEEEIQKLKVIIEHCKVSETKITFQGLAKALNCPAIILHERPYENMIKEAQTEQQLFLRKKEKNEVHKRARDFINSKLECGEPTVAYEVYTHIGKGINHLKRHFPWLRKWITLVAKKDQENRIRERKEELIDGVYLAIESLAKSHMKVNLQEIANHLGVTREMIRLYPEVTEAVNQAKLYYQVGVVKKRSLPQ